VSELPLSDEDYVQKLLELWIPSLGVREDFANEVHGALYFEGVSLLLPLYYEDDTDHLGGGHYVE
jgi:hypothetical protein